MSSLILLPATCPGSNSPFGPPNPSYTYEYLRGSLYAASSTWLHIPLLLGPPLEGPNISKSTDVLSKSFE